MSPSSTTDQPSPGDGSIVNTEKQAIHDPGLHEPKSLTTLESEEATVLTEYACSTCCTTIPGVISRYQSIEAIVQHFAAVRCHGRIKQFLVMVALVGWQCHHELCRTPQARFDTFCELEQHETKAHASHGAVVGEQLEADMSASSLFTPTHPHPPTSSSRPHTTPLSHSHAQANMSIATNAQSPTEPLVHNLGRNASRFELPISIPESSMSPPSTCTTDVNMEDTSPDSGARPAQIPAGMSWLFMLVYLVGDQ